MPSSVDDIIKDIEGDDPLQIPLEDIRQATNSFGSDEWCLVLDKSNVSLRHFASVNSLNNSQLEKVRAIAAILSSVDVSDVKYLERNKLAESIGLMLSACQNARIQKSLTDVILSWVKKEWLLTSPSLYPTLKFVAYQVRLHKKVVDIKNLAALANTAAYAVRCSGDITLINELCSLAVNPDVFQSQEARKFTIKLFEQAPERLHDQVKLMLSTCERKLGKALGDLYFRCVSTFTGPVKDTFLQSCLQDLANWSLCMPDETLAQTLIEAMVYVNKKLKITKSGSDDLFEVYAPFLIKMTEVPNCIFRVRSAKLLLTAFPLASTKSSRDENEELFTRQLNVFERLLEDDVPEVRATSISGLCEVASCIAEVLPTGWLQRVLGKVFVRLAFDVSSPDVRLACVKGLGRIVENHVLWPLAEHLFKETKYLLHDKSLIVRTAFAQLLDKIAKLHAFKPSNHLSSRADFLPRLAMDDPSVCRPLTSLLIEIYFPADKDAIAHLDICINLVETNPEAASIFYRHAITQLSFLRATAFIEIVLRHLAIKSSRVLKQIETDPSESDITLQVGGGGGDASVLEAGQSLAATVDRLCNLTEVAAACWLALLPQLRQSHHAGTFRDLERSAASALPRIFKLCEHCHREASTVVLLASCLPWRTVPTIFQKTVGFLRRSSTKDKSEESDTADFRKATDVAIRALTNWAKLGELLDIILESVRESVTSIRNKMSNESGDDSKRRSARKRVRFVKAKVKLNVEQSGDADMETHLALLDMLLHHRGCVRQLRGKLPQMHDIWEELKKSLDLVATVAQSNDSPGRNSFNDVERQLLLCFEFYCRIGLFLHVDVTKVPAVADDNFLKQLAAWLRGHTGIFSGANGKNLTAFQESMCHVYLNGLSTRLMLNAVPLETSEDITNSGIGPLDVFEIALDAVAFIPTANRCALSEHVFGLIYASLVKLVTANGQLTQQERGEHFRLILSYLDAIEEKEGTNCETALSIATSCVVLLARLWKKSETAGSDNVSEERIHNCFSALVSIVVKAISANKNAVQATQEDDNDDVVLSQLKESSKGAQDIHPVFQAVFSRFLASAIRSIFLPKFFILEQKLPTDGKLRSQVFRWLTSIGYKQNEIPQSLLNNPLSEIASQNHQDPTGEDNVPVA